MDDNSARRKSLRKNMRTNYKAMLDPLEEDKYGNTKEDKSLLQSLGLFSATSTGAEKEANSSLDSINSIVILSDDDDDASGSNNHSVSKVPSKTPRPNMESSVRNKAKLNLENENISLQQLNTLNHNRDPVVKLDKLFSKKKSYKEIEVSYLPDGQLLCETPASDSENLNQASSKTCTDEDSINILEQVISNNNISVTFKSTAGNEAQATSNLPKQKTLQETQFSVNFLNQASYSGSKTNNDEDLITVVDDQDNTTFNSKELLRTQKKVTIVSNSPFNLVPLPLSVDLQDKAKINKRKSILKGSPNLSVSPQNTAPHQPQTKVRISTPPISDGGCRVSNVNQVQDISKQHSLTMVKGASKSSTSDHSTNTNSKTIPSNSINKTSLSERSPATTLPFKMNIPKQVTNFVNKSPYTEESMSKLETQKLDVMKLKTTTAPLEMSFKRSEQHGESHRNLPLVGSQSEIVPLDGFQMSPNLPFKTKIKKSQEQIISTEDLPSPLEITKGGEQLNTTTQNTSNNINKAETDSTGTSSQKKRGRPKKSCSEPVLFTSPKLGTSSTSNYSAKNGDMDITPKQKKRGRPRKSCNEALIISPKSNNTLNNSGVNEGENDPDITPIQKRVQTKESSNEEELFISPKSNNTLNNSDAIEAVRSPNITPIQKKRGRPKKNCNVELLTSPKSNNSTNSDTNEVVTDSDVTPTKKKGGKPKKSYKKEEILTSPKPNNIINADTNEEDTDPDTGLKTTTGRPKKTCNEDGFLKSPVANQSCTSNNSESNTDTHEKNKSNISGLNKVKKYIKTTKKLETESESASDTKQVTVGSKEPKPSKRPYKKRTLKADAGNKKKKNLAMALSAMNKKRKKLYTNDAMLLPTQSSAASSPAVCSTDIDHTGDMPLIFNLSNSEVAKITVTKVKQNLKQCHKAIKKERSTRRKSLKESSTKKKRGRKRIRALEPKGDSVEETDELPQIEKKERKKSQRRTGRRFSVTGNWYIAAGYLNDIISLLEDFDSADSWRFKTFAKCWRDKSFSLVYRGRQTFKELLEFSEEIALLTKRFLGPPHSIKRRIGALYALYGLCHKFPLGRRHFFNLRFELEEYNNLLELVQPFRSNMENPDPAYIFRKLELEGAILHCVTTYEPCYDFHNEEREYVEVEYGKQRLAKSSAVNIAVPKVQLQTDSNLLQHYHSMKGRLAGDEDNPEKALCMISSDFLNGISTNLMQLRQDTLTELGMVCEDTCTNVGVGAAEESALNPDDPSQTNSTDMEMDEVVHTVDKHIISTVNNGRSGQRTQKAIENNQLTRDEAIKAFMRPPSQEDLTKPLRLQKKTASKKPKLSYSMDWKENVCTLKPKEEPKDGRVLLDTETEPPQYQELREALLPQPPPLKKKRSNRRPATLLKAASYVPRQRKKLSENATGNVNKPVSLSSPVKETSSTRCLVSELADVKPVVPEGDTTMIEVHMEADGFQKTVKLKVKVNLEQFKEIQTNHVRFTNFKNKLKPLIQETQKGKDKEREWVIEDIILPSEVDNKENAPAPNDKDSEKEVPVTSSVSSTSKQNALSLKQRYECLRHSDDDENSNDVYDPLSDEEDFKKPKKETDVDFCVTKAELEENVEEDPLEYECDEMNEEDEEWETERPRIRTWRWRKKGKGRWNGWWDDERGPRDSDLLLQAEPESKSVSMVPLKVGDKIKYFPMINSEPTTDQPNATEPHDKSIGEDPPFISDPADKMFKYTWNDFSSEKEPPMKRRRCGGRSSFQSYIFSPRVHIKTGRDSPKKEEPSSPVSSDSEPEKEVGETIESFDSTALPNTPPHSISPAESPIKKEAQMVLKELEDDWDDPYDVSQPDLQEDSVSEEGDTSVTHMETNVSLDEGTYFDDGHDDPVYAGASHDEFTHTRKQVHSIAQTFNQPLQQEHINNAFSHKNNSFEDVTEILPEISEILPTISTSTPSVYGNNIQVIPVNLNKNLSLEIGSEALLPGTFLFDDNFDGSMVESVDQPVMLPQNILNVDLGNPDPSKQPLYYKMTASDGNDIFIPISALPDIGSKKIEILSFDMAETKPFSPSKSLSIVGSPPPSFSSTVHEPNNYIPNTPTASIPPPNSFGHTFISSNASVNPSLPPFTPSSSQSLLTTHKLSSLTEPFVSKPSCSSQSPSLPTKLSSLVEPFVSKPSCSSQSPSLTPKLSSLAEPFSSKPSCSFLFSPKLNALKKFPSATGLASGKPPPPPQEPKVKFLFKGFLKSRK